MPPWPFRERRRNRAILADEFSVTLASTDEHERQSMSKRNPVPDCRALGAVLLLAAGTVAAAPAAPPAAGSADAVDGSDEAVVARLTVLRDEFVQRVGEVGYKACAAPVIELGDPPSFGNYVAKRNTLIIGAWSHLSADEKQGFEDMARKMGPGAAARPVFENGTYRWVFVRELGHWWQTCQHKRRPQSYAEESGASRVALAYWHEQDPQFAGHLVRGFRTLVNSRASPVPAGQSPQKYFDAHYQSIIHSDDYVWFQGKIISDLAEHAPPSFHQALAQPLYPK
jgi:hypothetical protein